MTFNDIRNILKVLSESFVKCSFSIHLLNKDIFFNLTCTLKKCYLTILEYVMKGTMSQTSDLAPSFLFHEM